jgi:DNA-directed RNA polymerase subunit RPC12/RpoP
MSNSIPLHPKLGVNPHLSYCPRCGGDAEELMLIGNRTAIVKCESCGNKVIGGLRSGEKCPACQHRSTGRGEHVGSVGEHDKLPASRPCAKCRQELAEHKAIVEAGGLYFRCKECNKQGVIKAEAEFAKALRLQHNKPAPELCGVEFEKCSDHGE